MEVLFGSVVWQGDKTVKESDRKDPDPLCCKEKWDSSAAQVQAAHKWKY